jgi:hypothetical protein
MMYHIFSDPLLLKIGFTRRCRKQLHKRILVLYNEPSCSIGLILFILFFTTIFQGYPKSWYFDVTR